MPTAAIPYLMAASLAVGAKSAYDSNQNAQAANATAQKGIADQEAATAAQDKQLTDAQSAAQAKQGQDSQWMAMKSQMNKLAGLSTQAPGTLAGQTGSLAGSNADKNAGKTLVGQ